MGGWNSAVSASGADLAEEMGRSEVRVWSAPYRPRVGLTVTDMALPERLERLGYERVRVQPENPGQYFWGYDVFWVYSRSHRAAGRPHPAELWGLDLDPTGRVEGYLEADGSRRSPRRRGFRRSPWIEPELLSESLTADRTPRVPLELDALPEHVWRPLLAAEDSRFFDHVGLDARGIARALLKNALAGEVVQGGSTITQQVIKMRELTPKRTLGRKASEAVRALALEAEYDKREILEAYLDHVYLGHHEGLGVYGYGAGARVWFGEDVEDLDLAEAAALAALVQGPNRLHPVRRPQRLRERQEWVLDRLRKLDWASRREVRRARRQGLSTLDPGPPPPSPARHLLSWVRELARGEAAELLDDGRGVWVETNLDPILQRAAEEAVEEGLEDLRERSPRLRRRPLTAALVALDADTGDVLAYVGGDPADRGDDFDRARRARRQPGSTVKPLVLLEAFQRCGRERSVGPDWTVEDRPLTLDLPSGSWTPANPSGRFRGTVTLRQALIESLNVPFVRLARHCGFDAVADRFEEAGLDLPDSPPPAFVLGAVEVSPLELASAYVTFSHRGRRMEPRPVRRLERPSGARLERWPEDRDKVVKKRTAREVRELLAAALERVGDGGLEGLGAYGKTGTSSDSRDAWMAGGAGSVVAVVWVGLDDGEPLGWSGGAAAAPIWRSFLITAGRVYASSPP